jgi:hypothetical protein
MRPMCAMLALKWRFELANVFALFRERCFETDTIPKPGGLGFARAQSARLVRSLSGFCPERVRPLSGS